MNRDFDWLEKALRGGIVTRVDCPNCKADGMRSTVLVEASDSDTIAWLCESCGANDIKSRLVPPPPQPGDPGPQLPPNDKPNGRHRRNREFKGFLSSATFLASRLPPDYLIDGLLLRGSIYTLTGPTGAGKTLIALLMAIRAALDGGFCGRECRQGTVAFFAGENPDNVKTQFYSMCADLDIDGDLLPIVWHEGVVDIHTAAKETKAALAAYPDLVLCIYDSLQAFFTGDDDNANMAMLDLTTGFRALTDGHPNRPAALVLAHPTKSATRDNLLPRGGGSVVNEVDGNLTAWAENNVVDMHWKGKFRGAPFSPIKLELVLIKPEGLVDARGDQMPCTVIRPLGKQRESEMRHDKQRQHAIILEAIAENPEVTQEMLASLISASTTTVQRRLDDLSEKGWYRDYGTHSRRRTKLR